VTAATAGVSPPYTGEEDFRFMNIDVRGFLRTAAVLLPRLVATGWAFLNGTRTTRLLKIGIAVAVPILFDLSVSSLNRTAPGFSDARFQEVIGDHLEGRKLTLDDLRKRLGKPRGVENLRGPGLRTARHGSGPDRCLPEAPSPDILGDIDRAGHSVLFSPGVPLPAWRYSNTESSNLQLSPAAVSSAVVS
jgi:hypothetical protein